MCIKILLKCYKMLSQCYKNAIKCYTNALNCYKIVYYPLTNKTSRASVAPCTRRLLILNCHLRQTS